jgi:hypothetical protein
MQIDEAAQVFAIAGKRSGRLSERRRYAGEERDHFGLTVAAGFFHHRLNCVRIVVRETPPSVAMSSTVLPEARLRATRASAGVKSNSDCTSSTGGACGIVTGVKTSAAAQRTKMSRAESRWE